MYVPRHFAEDDPSAVASMCRSAGFGHLVTVGPEGLTSTPLPFVVDVTDAGLSSVRAHLARPNPIWRLAPRDALLIVPIDDAYVSPTWYPSKAEHGKAVPTWNYEVVHVHGRLVAHDDPVWVDRQIRELTDEQESTLRPPWSVDDAPAEFIATMRRGIVGVELQVARTIAKRKLGQNRSAADIDGAITGLIDADRPGADRIARAMSQLPPR